MMLVAFSVAGFLMVRVLQSYLFHHLEEDARNQARIHTEQLSTVLTAKRIINAMTEQWLKSATDGMRNLQGLENEALLNKIMREMKLSAVCWYGSDGVVRYSSAGDQGRSVRAGELEYSFWKGNEDYLLDEVRLDPNDGQYYRYAYARLDDGGFVRVGIRSEEINALLGEFRPQTLVNKLANQDNVLDAFYLSAEPESAIRGIMRGNMLHSVRSATVYMLTDAERAAIDAQEPYFARITYRQIPAYETLLPIHIDGEHHGTLIIFYSFLKEQQLVYTIAIIALGLLLAMFMTNTWTRYQLGSRAEKITQLAYYDPTTGLGNLKRFAADIEDSLLNHNVKNRALILIAHQNLNLVKMMHGSQALTDLLQTNARVLKELVSDEEYLFRLNDDIFCIGTCGYEQLGDVLERCRGILDALDGIKDVVESGKIVTRRIGVVEMKENDCSEELLHYVDIGINELQKMGKSDESIWVFDRDAKEALLQDEVIEKELRRARYNGYDKEFYMVYQPQVSLRMGRTIGFEALARWNSCELGNIPPSRFIGIAEKSNQMISLGDWIIRTVCGFVKELEQNGAQGFRVAINIASVQLLDPAFADRVAQIIAEVGIDPKHLELELTESSYTSNYAGINENLDALRSKGLTVALDDFGTHYSTLARLKGMNIDVLKIDKSFIDTIDGKQGEDPFIQSILLLANKLELSTVAEGVETQEQLNYLAKIDCDIIQGYIFSKPLPAPEAHAFFKKSGSLR